MKRALITTALLLVTLCGFSQTVYKASFFGIRSNGVYDNTTSIQGAIDYISAKGGGVLEFSVGRYVTGAVELKSGVDIKLREGAVIVGSTNIYSYQGKPAIFWAEGRKDITIFGDGVIDGRGQELLDELDYQKKLGHVAEGIAVPSLLSFKNCTGIKLQNFILRNPATSPDLYFIEGGGVEVEGCYTDTL